MFTQSAELVQTADFAQMLFWKTCLLGAFRLSYFFNGNFGRYWGRGGLPTNLLTFSYC